MHMWEYQLVRVGSWWTVGLKKEKEKDNDLGRIILGGGHNHEKGIVAHHGDASSRESYDCDSSTSHQARDVVLWYSAWRKRIIMIMATTRSSRWANRDGKFIYSGTPGLYLRSHNTAILVSVHFSMAGFSMANSRANGSHWMILSTSG